MADTTFSTTGAPLQPIKAIFYSPTLVGGALRAWNPTLGTPAFDNITSGNWAQHLITVPEPGSLGIYTIDVSTLAPVIMKNVFLDAKFYNSVVPGDLPFAVFPTVFWNGEMLAPAANALRDTGGMLQS